MREFNMPTYKAPFCALQISIIFYNPISSFELSAKNNGLYR